MNEDIIKRYKQYLTNAQVKELAAKAERYKLLNAQRRAEAQNSILSQQRQVRRGLQNVGLASREGKVISGMETARNDALTNAYAAYNRQLRKVEDAQTQNAAARMASANIAAQRRAAEQVAQQQAEEQAQLQQQIAAQQTAAQQAAALKRAGIGNLLNKEVSDSGSGFQTAADEQSFYAYDPRKHTDAENIRYYQRVAQMNGLRGSEANTYALDKAREAGQKNAEYRAEGRAMLMDPTGKTRERMQGEIGKVEDFANSYAHQFSVDYGVSMAALKNTDPKSAAYVEERVNDLYSDIEAYTPKWNKMIAAGGKEAADARRSQAKIKGELDRIAASVNVPAEYRELLYLTDDAFETAFGAEEELYEKQLAEGRVIEGDFNARKEAFEAGKEVNGQDIQREATIRHTWYEKIKEYRAETSEANMLAQSVPISDRYKDKYPSDGSSIPTIEYVYSNQKQLNWHPVNWANPADYKGSNWRAARDHGWSADDYAKKHDTNGSKYAALVNEWSYIGGRQANLYAQDKQTENIVLNAGEFIGTIFGGKINRNAAYEWFRNECVMTFNGEYETSGTSEQKEQMDAMLTLANLMTDEERARFNTLKNTIGGKDADEYFEYLYNNVLPQRFRQYITEYLGEEARDGGFLGRSVLSLGSVGTNLVQGVTKPLQTMFSKQTDPVAAQLSAAKANTAQSMRGAVGQHYGKVGSFLYQTGMSMADSATVALISQGLGNVFSGALKGLGVAAETAAKIGSKAGSLLGGSILGGSAYNSAYDEALQRGLSPEKARMTAFGNGVNEMLFESLSLDLLVSRFKTGDMLKVSKYGFVNWFVNTLVQGGVEGSEEVFTDMANNLWDKSVNKIYAEELTKLREYISQGMSYEDAKKRVSEEYADQLWQSFLGGAISGGVMGGAAGAMHDFQMRGFEKQGKSLDSGLRSKIDGFQFKDKQMQELQKQSKKTNQDYGVLLQGYLAEKYRQFEGNVQQAVKDGTITNDDAALLEKWQKDGVQTVDKDGNVVGNKDGITAEQMQTVNETLSKLDIEPLMEIAQAQQQLQFNKTVGVKNAENLRALETKQNEALKQYNKEAAKIDADDSLTDAQKEQKKAEAYQKMTEAQSRAGDELSAKVGKKVDIKVEKDGMTVKTKNGSGNVTFDFSTYNDGKTENHNTVESMTEREKAALRIAQVVAALNGTNIKVESQFTSRKLADGTVEDLSKKNGYYDPETDTIHVNLNGTNSVLWTISHELTHRLATMNKQGYTELHDTIKNELTKENLTYSEVQALEHSYQIDKLQEYLNNGMNLWDALVAYEESRGYKGADAEEEVIARCCEQFLAKTTFINSFASKHYKTARSISAFLTRMNADMQQLFADVNTRSTRAATTRNAEGMYETWNTDTSPEQDILNQVDALDDIARKWENAVKKVDQKRKEMNEKSAQAAEVKYSTKNTQYMTWDEQMKQYFSKNHGTLKSSDTLCIGKSGTLYSGFGMKDSLISIPQSTITKGMREKKGSRSAHELSEANIINLGKGIMKPLAIVDNANRDCVYVVVNDVDPYGSPVIAVINKNKSIDYVDTHEVISAFGMKDFLTYIREHIPQGSRIEIFDKKKLSKRLLGNDVQFVELDTSLREFAYVILHEDEANVKKEDSKSQQKFSTQDIETSSVITDEEYAKQEEQYYTESASITNEIQELITKRQEIERSDEYKRLKEKAYDKDISDDEWKDAVEALARYEEESGYSELIAKQKELRNKQGELSKKFEKLARDKRVYDHRQAVKESGLTEAEYSRKQAIKEFGYTPYYHDAGYILPNGKMLNFSGEKGRHFGTRGQDHRAIGKIYPDSQGSEAMIRFMNDGNIRIMAETPGVDLSSKVEPTREQYATIRAFAESSRREEYFNVDLSDERGNNVGTLEYDGNVNPTRIINDIKHFYETGEVREQSSVSQFHYSTQDKDFHLTQRIGEQRVFEMRGTTANVYGSSVELEGGTLLNRVRMMQNLAELYGSVTVTATSEKEAQAFEKAGAQRETDTFGDTKYGTWAFEHQEDQYRKDTEYDAKQKRNFANAVMKEVGTYRNFSKDDMRIIRAKLEKAFAVLHNAWHGDGDQLVAWEYADRLFDQILNRYTEMTEADAEMREAILAEMPRKTDAKGRVYREIEVTAAQMAEIRTAFESVAEYNRAISKALGTRVVVKETENPQTLEDVFASNPYLDATTNEGDMPTVLLDRAQETVGKRTNPYKAESEERAALKEAMFEKALGIVGIEKSTTQRVREAVKEARAEERKKAKTKLEIEVDKARLAERMHEGAIRAKERRLAKEREETIKRTAREREAKLKEITQQKLMKQKVEQLRRDTRTIALRWNQRLVKMLANPTEASHIPIQLAREVAEFTDALTRYLDSGTERGQLNLEKIAMAYERSFADKKTIAQAKKEDPNYDPRGLIILDGKTKETSSQYDEQLVDMMNELNRILQTKTLRDLNPLEMRMLLNTVRGVANTVYEANRMIGMSERKAIWQVGSTMVDQLEAAPKISRAERIYLAESLDLRRLAKVFSGSDENAEFVKLVKQLNDGAIEKERIAQALQSIFKPVTDQYGDEIRKWYGKNAEWIDTGIKKNGHKIEITKGMRVSLAMHVLNEGNMRHIENGGLTIPNREMYRKGMLKDAYANGELVRLKAEQIEKIISHMTDAEKAYVRAAKELFHKRTGYYINRTSLALLGYRKAIVENYFPIHTDNNFTKTDFAELKKDGSIEGQGFLKERVEASNPVYLEDITSVVNRQIRGVALYAGLAIPMRNFNAVMNASIYEDDNGVWSPKKTVKQVLIQKMGSFGADVVEGFLTDVSEMSHVDVSPMERFAGKLATNYVKAVLLGNLKVALKQVASYPTAAAVIPWKYLRKGLTAEKVDVDLIDKYTPLYQMRREGNANEIAYIMQKRGMEQKLPWLLGWITKMDVMTVGRLWSAAEYMVADQQKDLPVGSDAYYKAVAKVFNDTVQQTQPNFSPLQRNAALRSKNPIVRSFVLFGTQRMQNGGILMEAAYELKHSKGKSKAEIQAAKRKLGRAVASQIVQNVLLIVASLGVDALRGRMKGWQDDDEKKVTAESLLKGIGDMFLSNAMGSFLGGSELYELLSAWYKDDAYDTEFTVPALEALEFIFNYVGKELPKTYKYLKSSEHTLEEKLEKAKTSGAKLVKAAGYATGFPFENAYKDLMKGIIPAIEDHKDYFKTGEFPQWWLHQSGKLDSAKTYANYKEWTDAGKKGSVYFYWEKKLKDLDGGYTAKAQPLFEDRTLSDDDKAMLLRMLSDGDGWTNKGAVVYNANGDVKVDFTNIDTFRVSQLSDAKYQGMQKAVSMGVPEDYAATAFIKYTDIRKEMDSGYNDAFREWLQNTVKSPEQRAALELCVIGGNGEQKQYALGQDLIKSGMSSDEAYMLIEQMQKIKKADSEQYLAGLTEAQKKLIYEYKGWKWK